MRQNYCFLAIGFVEITFSTGIDANASQGKAFREDIEVGDKVVVCSGYVWALGKVGGAAREVIFSSEYHLYFAKEKQLGVEWSK